MLGFGAELGKRRQVKNYNKHCFTLNENDENPFIEGLDKMLATYRQATKTFIQSEPTNYFNVINKVLKRIEQEEISQENQKYTILLILTDGCAQDLDQTINVIVKSSFYPISIAIIGIGDADFSQMNNFNDAVNQFKSSTGQRMDRDMIQFIRQNDMKNNINKLAENVLKKVPSQFQSYFQKNNIKPNSPKQTIRIQNSESVLQKQDSFYMRLKHYNNSIAPKLEVNGEDQKQEHITDYINTKNSDKEDAFLAFLIFVLVIGIGLVIFFYNK